METSGVTALIWHFAGYLRLPPADLFSAKPIFDGAESARHVAETNEQHGKHTPTELGEFQFSGHSSPELREPEPYHWRLLRTPHAKAHPDKAHFPAQHLAHLSSQHTDAPTTGGSGEALPIYASYAPGGSQEVVGLVQANSLASDNSFNALPGQMAENGAYADDALNQLMSKAVAAIPSFEEPAGGADNLISFVSARDSHPAATMASEAPLETTNGQFLNGAHVAAGDDLHALTNTLVDDAANALSAGLNQMPIGPTGNGLNVSEETVSVGANTQANVASIADFASATVALAVFGNYVSTGAIIQTNVYEQDNHFTGLGAGLQASANAVNNVAAFETGAPSLSSSSGGGVEQAAEATYWNVSVLNGSLYDVNSLSQFNYLQNNNVVNESISQNGESLVVAGGNAQVNSAILQTLQSGGYGLIIVEGNYHQDNLIYQTNVVLDANAVSATSGAGAMQTATSGGDQIVNDASISNQSNLNAQPFSASALSVTAALEGQHHSLNPSAVANAFPELAGANVNVLIVTGEYYDINAISQTNILSNSNVVGLSVAANAPAGAEQTVETGGNHVVNSASILDVGSAASPYLQGSMYSDMILLQTNIIGGEHPGVVGENPAQLANEVIAFATDESSNPAALSGAGDHTTTHQSADVLGSVMH